MTEETDEEIENYVKAGEIARKAVEESRALIRPGARLLDIAEKIEQMIQDKGAKPAFPLNISVNEYASHYTPAADETTVLGEKDLVNVDIGTHVDGFIGDVAYTVDLSGENQKLVEASQQALQDAISMVRAGAKTNEIGKTIEETIKKFGFKPIENLSGHGLEQYEAHAEPSIPNIAAKTGEKLEEGTVIAIEPFATTGSGSVKEDRRTEIFSLAQPVLTRNATARDLMVHIAGEYQTLPFAERWLAKKWPVFQLKIALRELIQRDALYTYPILKDVAGSLVSQAETTMLVEKDGCKILT